MNLVKIVFADADQTARVPENVRTVAFGDGDDPFDGFKILSDETFPSFFPGRDELRDSIAHCAPTLFHS